MARTESPLLNPRRIPPAAAGAGAQGRPPGRAPRTRTGLARRSIALRIPLRWVGMVGVPLAVTAAILTASWWALVPLVGCTWLCTPGVWARESLIALETGVVGAIWAALGAYGLTAWPSHRPMVGVLWAASAGTMAVVAVLRRRARRN